MTRSRHRRTIGVGIVSVTLVVAALARIRMSRGAVRPRAGLPPPNPVPPSGPPIGAGPTVAELAPVDDDVKQPDATRRRTPASPRVPPTHRARRSNTNVHSRRRISFWVGVGLLLAGLTVLSWLAWEVWGTTWISQREERREVTSFEHNRGGPPALLEIPRFGSDYVVPINEGTSAETLSRGVGHFLHTGPGRTTTRPGQIGNYALAGHRITHGQPFSNLPALRPGDKVYVVTHQLTYVYVIDTDPNGLIVPFTASWVLGEHPVNPLGGPQPRGAANLPIITLTTCSELFHTDNRMVAFGHLLRTYPTSPLHPTELST